MECLQKWKKIDSFVVRTAFSRYLFFLRHLLTLNVLLSDAAFSRTQKLIKNPINNFNNWLWNILINHISNFLFLFSSLCVRVCVFGCACLGVRICVCVCVCSQDDARCVFVFHCFYWLVIGSFVLSCACLWALQRSKGKRGTTPRPVMPHSPTKWKPATE